MEHNRTLAGFCSCGGLVMHDYEEDKLIFTCNQAPCELALDSCGKPIEKDKDNEKERHTHK